MKRAVWFLVSCLFASGCGGTGDVKGTVSYKGEKLTFGSVTAHASNGSFADSIKEDGTYELKGLGVGEVKFFVYVQDPKAVAATIELSNKAKESQGKGGGRVGGLTTGEGASAAAEVVAKQNMVPEKYSDMTNPILIYTVKGGANNFDILLTP